MKTAILLILLSFSYYNVSKENKKENSLEEHNLNGKISVIVDSTFNAFEKNGEIKAGMFGYYTISKYNEVGNKIEENSHRSMGDYFTKYTTKHGLATKKWTKS